MVEDVDCSAPAGLSCSSFTTRLWLRGLVAATPSVWNRAGVLTLSLSLRTIVTGSAVADDVVVGGGLVERGKRSKEIIYRENFQFSKTIAQELTVLIFA